MKGDLETLKVMLAKGADVNSQDKEGHTALMTAAHFGNVEIAELLLASGADVFIKNKKGELALKVVVIRCANDNCEKLANSLVTKMAAGGYTAAEIKASTESCKQENNFMKKVPLDGIK